MPLVGVERGNGLLPSNGEVGAVKIDAKDDGGVEAVGQGGRGLAGKTLASGRHGRRKAAQAALTFPRCLARIEAIEERYDMPITIDLPPAVVQDAMAFAQSRNTTLAVLVGDYLESVAGQERSRREAEAEKMFAFLMSQKGTLADGYKFDREAANAR